MLGAKEPARNGSHPPGLVRLQRNNKPEWRGSYEEISSVFRIFAGFDRQRGGAADRLPRELRRPSLHRQQRANLAGRLRIHRRQGGENAAAIAGTSDPRIFQTVRWNPTNYSFRVLSGTYTVNLLFAEVNPKISTGGRIFNVKMQGATVLQNFDTFASAGGLNKAVVMTVENVMAINGALLIEFVPVSGMMPKISGIEILPATPAGAPRLMLNFMHPDGSPVSGRLTYIVNSSLGNLQGSMPLVNGQAVCYLLDVPSALGLSQQYQVNLTLADDAGKVLWQFSLGVNPATVNFGAVRDSVLTVVVQP